MEILDADTGLVLGAGPVGADGKYAVRFSRPLADGTHKVRVTATDAMGTSAPTAGPTP